MKAKKFIIHAHTYPFSVRVIITKDISKVVKYVNKKQHRKGSKKYSRVNFENNYGMFCRDDKYEPVIWMPEKPKTAKQLATAAHEVLHAVFENMDCFGIHFNSGSEEAFTYLHTHLMLQFLNKCGII